MNYYKSEEAQELERNRKSEKIAKDITRHRESIRKMMQESPDQKANRCANTIIETFWRAVYDMKHDQTPALPPEIKKQFLDIAIKYFESNPDTVYIPFREWRDTLMYREKPHYTRIGEQVLIAIFRTIEKGNIDAKYYPSIPQEQPDVSIDDVKSIFG